MKTFRRLVAPRADFLAAAALACLSAALLEASGRSGALPAIGDLPLFPLALGAAAVGLPALMLLQGAAAPAYEPSRPSLRGALGLLALGAVLALPPVTIDLAVGFPRDLNVPLPEALFFYTAIALVAEVVFHLLPLAVLALALPGRGASVPVLAVVALVEPVFQAAQELDSPLRMALVFANVGLVSAAQMALFRRYGFGAMIGLRLAFYACWHLLWGTARLHLLF